MMNEVLTILDPFKSKYVENIINNLVKLNIYANGMVDMSKLDRSIMVILDNNTITDASDLVYFEVRYFAIDTLKEIGVIVYRDLEMPSLSNLTTMLVMLFESEKNEIGEYLDIINNDGLIEYLDSINVESNIPASDYLVDVTISFIDNVMEHYEELPVNINDNDISTDDEALDLSLKIIKLLNIDIRFKDSKVYKDYVSDDVIIPTEFNDASELLEYVDNANIMDIFATLYISNNSENDEFIFDIEKQLEGVLSNVTEQLTELRTLDNK